MRIGSKLLGRCCGVVLALLACATAPAGAMYLPDGSKDDGAGGYMNPDDGMCVVGVAADGTMLIDGSITTARDCVAWTKSGDSSVNLAGLDTKAKCQVADGAGNDGYRHGWSTSICYDTVNSAGISRVDLDNTAAMCTSKGGTVVTSGKCVAYGWVYRNRKSDGSLVPTGTGLYTSSGAAAADGLGFCYASMDMTSATYADRDTCPSEHNNNPPAALSVCKDANKASVAACQIASNRVWSTSLPGGAGCFVTNVNDTTACSALGAGYSWISFVAAGVAPAGEWTACLSNPVAGCQSQASYDAGLGWSLPDGSAASITAGTTSNSVVRVCQDTAKGDQSACEAANTAAVPFVFYWNPDLGICVDTSLTTTGTSLTCKTATRAGVQIVVFSDNDRCIYQYGQKGKLAASCQPVDSLSPVGIGTVVDLTAVGYDTQGECLAGGFSWDNWLPDINRSAVTPVQDPNLPAGAQIVKLDATTAVKDGGGNYYSGTGSVCLKCHADQSRSYMERTKRGFVETPHKLAGDTAGPWQANFLAAASPWGLKGVQCTMCHSTARPAVDDLIQVIPAGIVGPPAAGAPISATGHNKTEYAAHVTDVCFTCHGNFPSANPAYVVPVSSGDVTLTGKGLAPIGNQFLNSPHAKYTAATSAKVDIGDKSKYSSTFLGYICRSSNSIGGGSILTTVYRNGVAEKIPNLDSLTNTACTNPGNGTATSGAAGFWVKDGEAISGGTPADNAQGSCMTCHDVHWDFDSADPEAEPIRRECTTCHMNSGTSATVAPQIDLTTINHLKTVGTPLQHVATEPYESCVICHMPKSSAAGSRMHLWRVNPDDTYSTMGTSQANTAADGTYTNAAWVDVDLVCGQCHGGGTNSTDNPPKTTPVVVPYYTKAELAAVATGMHSAAGVSYPVTFTASASGLTVSVAASVTCGGTCPSLTYDWNWGDGTANGTGASTSHPYAAAGTKTISLTVKLTTGLKTVGTVARNITILNPDGIPVAAGTCTWDANTWNMGVLDTSTDDGPDADTANDAPPALQIVVDWGDSTAKSIGTQGATFSHVYAKSGTFTVTQRATDAKLQTSTTTCSPPATPKYFVIKGTVKNRLGTAALGGATVQFLRGGIVVKTVTTSSTLATLGTFTSGTTLKPGTYTMKVTKAGYTFPQVTKTVGGNRTGFTIKALTP